MDYQIKKAAEPSLIELSKRIEEMLERLDELYIRYHATTDAVLRHNLKSAIRTSERTIAANRRLLRKIDGGVD